MNLARSQGAVLVEFSISLIFLIFLTSAVLEYGFAMRDRLALVQIAQNAAKMGSEIMVTNTMKASGVHGQSPFDCASSDADLQNFFSSWVSNQSENFGIKATRIGAVNTSIQINTISGGISSTVADNKASFVVSIERSAGGCIMCLGEFLSFIPQIKVTGSAPAPLTFRSNPTDACRY